VRRFERPRLAPLRRVWPLLVPLVLGSGLRDSAAAGPAGPMAARIDRFVEAAMRRNALPGLALAVTRDDRIVHLEGYGRSGVGPPVTPETQFLVASLSKSITAVAVLQLVEAGRLDLDAPVRRYLPEFMVADASAADRITIRHLLNHTSGLADRSLWEMGPPQARSIEERIHALRGARLVSQPGQEFHYTDANYAVLARLVEVVSGRPFADYLRAHVFEPLGMTGTTSVITSSQARREAPRLAQGHVVAFGVPVARDEPQGFLGGSSGVISTARDMGRFLSMQSGGGSLGGRRVLGPEMVGLMHTRPPGADSPYGMGWTIDRGAEPSKVIEHSGVLSTFYAHQVLLPESGYGIVFLVNADHALAGFEALKQGLIALVTRGDASVGFFGARTIGWILIGLTLLTLIGRLRSLVRLPRWAQRHRTAPRWRAIPGLVWLFLPAAVLLSLPWVVAAFTDRVFGYGLLFLAMPDVLVWLGVAAVTGILVGIGRIVAMSSFGTRDARARTS
jgi:CubicO group peptidase (beta-lactamase class C family)